MASIRDLKKDINFLTDEIIGNCFLHYYIAGEIKRKEIDKIIEETVAIRNDLISKINNATKNTDKKSRKSYYRSIREELIEKVNAAFDKLSKLEKEVAQEA